MLAYGFPLLSVAWAVVIFFAIATVFFTVIRALSTTSRAVTIPAGRRQAGPWSSSPIILPLLGRLIYLLDTLISLIAHPPRCDRTHSRSITRS